MCTFDEQVAEAQRLLRELDHSMAMYDSTHGSQTPSQSLANHSHNRSHLNGSNGTSAGEETSSMKQQQEAAALDTSGFPAASVESTRLANTSSVDSRSGVQERASSQGLVMAGEELDDLM